MSAVEQIYMQGTRVVMRGKKNCNTAPSKKKDRGQSVQRLQFSNHSSVSSSLNFLSKIC